MRPAHPRLHLWQGRPEGVLLLVALLLLSGCATSSPQMRAAVPTVGMNEGEYVFATLPANFAPVPVRESELAAALADLVLELPLSVASSRLPRLPERGLSPHSGAGGSGAAPWQQTLTRDYGGFCERRGTPGDCLELFAEGGSWLDEDDKRRIALVLAVGPALEARDAELAAMVRPERLAAMVGITVTTYMTLLLFPEPASKAVAGVFGLLLWGYLGWEFFELVQAYVQLRQEAAQATNWEELRAAGDRFGRVIGPNSVRILVLVGTATVGESAVLVSRMPRLPGFGQAARTVETNTGVRLTEFAEGAERVIVSVPEGSLALAESSIRVVLPANALAMTTGGQGKGRAVRPRGKALPNGHRAWGSHSGFTKAMGKAGKGKEWHHIVEQTPGNVKRFGPEALHNTENVIPLDKALHGEMSRLYSSKRMDITSSERLTVRQWLSTQSYEAQRQFGLLAMENVTRGIW